MAIPDFQSIMRPLLVYLADGKEHSNQEIHEALENVFPMTEGEKLERLPSGRQRVYVNRVAWAMSYLKLAGLLKSPRRSFYKISQRGIEALEIFPERITCKELMRYPEYAAWRQGTKANGPGSAKDECAVESTPEDQIELGVQQVTQRVSKDLLETIKACSPRFFEKLVIDLLLAMGYGSSRREAGQLTSRGSDEGIDGIISEDKLGLDLIYIQAKKWENNVSRPEIQKFAGALQGKRARKGIYITTSTFTRDAEEYAKAIDSKIVLINGLRLAELMLEHGVGVTTIQTFSLKKIDTDYFLEE